jgi:hypothetical protein
MSKEAAISHTPDGSKIPTGWDFGRGSVFSVQSDVSVLMITEYDEQRGGLKRGGRKGISLKKPRK